MTRTDFALQVWVPTDLPTKKKDIWKYTYNGEFTKAHLKSTVKHGVDVHNIKIF
jgi:hypothetical protein